LDVFFFHLFFNQEITQKQAQKLNILFANFYQKAPAGRRPTATPKKAASYGAQRLKHGRRRAFFQRGVPKAEHGHDFKTLWPRAAPHVLLSEVQRASK